MGVLDVFTRMIQGGSSGRMVTQRPDGQGQVLWSFNESSDSPLEKRAIEDLWKSQPHLRTVVNFLARNIAQLGLHSFVSDGESNVRVRGDAVSAVISKPNQRQTRYDLVFGLVADLALYDRAYLLCITDADREEGYSVYNLPSAWVGTKATSFYGATEFSVAIPGEDGGVVKFGADQIVEFEGWTPGAPGCSTSPVETLRLTLEEQHHARVHRKQLWKKNGRIGSFITRPKDAPSWDGEARKRFMSMLDAFVGDKGPRAGGMPLLEDGMGVQKVGFSSADEQWADSAKLSLATVAQVYHVNPTMIGLLDNANYSNVREFRRGLYGDTLGPIITMIEGRLNAFLLPMLNAPAGQFVEFNVEAKLRGSFEEQAAVISSSVGGPWMTRNEARRLQNLAAIEGGDKLIVPLNLGSSDGEGEDKPELTADELLKRGNFAATMIRSGFEPAAALEAAGLDSVTHLGLLPVTVQRPTEADGSVDTELVADLSAKATPHDPVPDVWSKCLIRQQAAHAKGWDTDRWDRELAADLTAAGAPDPNNLAKELNARTKSRLDEAADNPTHVFNMLILEVPQWQQ